MLTVTVKDTENNPISDAYVYIYKPSGSGNSYYTDNQGQIVKYYAGGEGFRWTYGEQEGNFDLTGDYALNITKQAATSFNLSATSAMSTTTENMMPVCMSIGQMPLLVSTTSASD